MEAQRSGYQLCFRKLKRRIRVEVIHELSHQNCLLCQVDQEGCTYTNDRGKNMCGTLRTMVNNPWDLSV